MDEQVGRRNTMTESEFCSAVGISRVMAWRLRKAKKLPHCRVGTKILYTPEHVTQFLGAHEQNGVGAAVPTV